MTDENENVGEMNEYQGGITGVALAIYHGQSNQTVIGKILFMKVCNREYPLHLCVIANKRGHSRSIPHSIHLINDLV